MTENVVVIVIAAAFSVALGKALDLAPIPTWVQWSLLAVVLLAGVVILQGVVSQR